MSRGNRELSVTSWEELYNPLSSNLIPSNFPILVNGVPCFYTFGELFAAVLTGIGLAINEMTCRLTDNRTDLTFGLPLTMVPLPELSLRWKRPQPPLLPQLR